MYVAKNDVVIAEGFSLTQDDVLLVTDDGGENVTLHLGESDVQMSRADFTAKVVESEDFESAEGLELDEEAEGDELSFADEIFAEQIGLEDDMNDADVLDESGELITESSQKSARKLVEQILEKGSVRDVLLAEVEGQNLDEAISAALRRSVKKLGGVIKKFKKVRGGKIVTIMKRVGGRIKRLTAKQKAALRKARSKAKMGGSVRKRLKSLKKRIAAHLK